MYLKKELYELIRTDESIFDFIQESSFDGLWYWDLEQPENEWMNDRFWIVLGYNPDEMPHKSSAWQNIINQDDLKAAKDKVSKHCENPNYPYDQVVRYTHKNGSTVWIRCRGLAIRDKNGKPIRMLGAHHDVTELKRSEYELLKAKEKAEESERKLQLINKELEIFKTIADNAVFGKGISDMNGNIIYINKFFANIHGYTPEELLGQNLSLFYNQKQMEEVGILIKSLIKNGYFPPTEVWHANREGNEFPMLMSGTLIKDETGNPLYLATTAVDITERKLAEEALKMSKELLSETESIGKVGGWSFNIDTMEQKWTDEVYRIHEVEISSNPSVDAGINYYTKDSRPIIEKAVQRAIEHGENFDLELEIITAKGNTRAVHTIGKVDLKNHRIYGFFQDITERKLAEEALSKSNQRLESLLEISQKITSTIDQNLIMQMIVDNAIRLIGLDTGAIYLERDDETVILSATTPPLPNNFPDDLRIANLKHHPHLEKALRTGKLVLIEDALSAKLTSEEKNIVDQRKLRTTIYQPITLREKTIGALILSSTETTRIFTHNDLKMLQAFANQTAHIIDNVNNYTSLQKYTHELEQQIKQREKAEQGFITAKEKAEESEKRFRKMFGFHSAIMLLIEPDTGKIVDANKSAVEFYGYDLLTLKSMHIQDINQLNQEYIREQRLNALKKNRNYFVFPHKLSNGKVRIVEIHSTPIYHEGKQILFSIIHDITERNMAEKELIKAKETAEKNEKRYRDLISNIKAGVVVHAPDTSVIMCNTRASELLGLSEEQMKGKVAIDPQWKFIDGENTLIPLDNYPIMRILTSKKAFSNQMVGVYRSKSDIAWLMVNGFPVLDDKDEISEIVISFIDITESKLSEKALIESQKLSAIGEMSSAVAHDFNNSLQSIFGNLELALLNIDKDNPARKYLDTMKVAASDAATRVQLLQRFAGNNKAGRDYTTIDINEIISDVLVQSRPLWKDNAEKKGLLINIETHIENDLFIMGNAGEIRSVFYNLIKNSVEAMDKGGSIIIRTINDNGQVRILFKDDGIGMDEKTKTRIFQPFFSTKGFDVGRGLGLSGAYSIIKEHKGKIFVAESTPGKGTTIEINFPKVLPDQIKTDTAIELDSHDAECSILWVDDDKMIREIAEEIISALGHTGDVVGSGEEALKKLESKKYDLIITDIGMPGMNGWELIDIINDKYDHNMKIALSTGWGDQISDEKKLKYGVSHIVGKPFKLVQLQSIIQDMMSN